MEVKKKRIARQRLLVLIAGIVFLATGLWRGEASEVLEKAVRICLECIGIG